MLCSHGNQFPFWISVVCKQCHCEGPAPCVARAELQLGGGTGVGSEIPPQCSHKRTSRSQILLRWPMPLFPGLRRPKPVDLWELEASLIYTVPGQLGPCLKTKTSRQSPDLIYSFILIYWGSMCEKVRGQLSGLILVFHHVGPPGMELRLSCLAQSTFNC